MTTPARPTDPVPLGLRRALVVGTGRSGLAAARLLAGADVEVVLVDERAHPAGPGEPGSGGPGSPEDDTAALAEATGAEVRLGRPATELLTADIELVVPSPGVPEDAAVLIAARRAGVPVWSEPELALRRHPRRLLAVTGTNGKTSTTELLTAICLAGGLDAVACGNIGRPVSEAAAATAPSATLVAELSSFQLAFTERLAPEVALLLNVAPDHLDWHRDLDSYHAAKARIFAAQGPHDWAVAGSDDATAVALRDATSGARPAGFSGRVEVDLGVGLRRSGPGPAQLIARLPGAEQVLCTVDALAPDGLEVPPHRLANVAAAATAALLAGVGPDAVVAGAVGHVPGRHRFETVAVDDRGVRYVDDSKATNPHAAVAALDAAGPAVWIAGGLAKGVDLAPLAGALGEVDHAVLIGTAAPDLAALCADAGVTAHLAEDLPAAVAVAATLARPGGTVLLAPACASFDQFDSYAHRGEVFRQAATTVAGSGEVRV